MATLFTKDSGLIEERLNPKTGHQILGPGLLYHHDPAVFHCPDPGWPGCSLRLVWQYAGLIYWSSVALYLIGQSIFVWARYTNRYFSSVVRIQTDRGQTVCKEGPYRFIRHPGYLGGFLFTATMGLMLGSWWALIPQFIAALILIRRTILEDRTCRPSCPAIRITSGKPAIACCRVSGSRARRPVEDRFSLPVREDAGWIQISTVVSPYVGRVERSWLI